MEMNNYLNKDIDIIERLILDIDNNYKIDNYDQCFVNLRFLKNTLNINDDSINYSLSNDNNKIINTDNNNNIKLDIKNLSELNNYVNKKYEYILYNKKNLIFNVQEDLNLVNTCLNIHKLIISTKPEREYNGISTWYLYDNKVNTLTMCCKCKIKTSIFHLLSVFSELDLMKEFIKKFEKIEKIGEFSMFRWVLDIKINLPSPLSNRDTIAYGIGKVLPEENSVLITFKSLENGLKEYCNMIVPESDEKSNYKRIFVNFGYHYIKIINNEECELYFCGNINPKVSFVPMFIINKVMKELAYYLMDAFRKQLENTKDSLIYKERREKNNKFYDMISEKLKILKT